MLYDPKWEVEAPAITRIFEPWRKVLLDAADYMERHGWCQGKTSDRYGRVCLVGAIIHTPGSLRVHSEALARLESKIGVVPSWNDKDGRTQEQCIAALRGAAE